MDTTKCRDCHIRLERDVAIQQLEAYGLKFGCIQEPLTREQVIEHISSGHPHEIAPLYIEFKKEFSLDYAPRWRDAYNLSAMSRSQYENYGVTWRCWYLKPTEEDRRKAEWKDENENERLSELSD